MVHMDRGPGQDSTAGWSVDDRLSGQGCLGCGCLTSADKTDKFSLAHLVDDIKGFTYDWIS